MKHLHILTLALFALSACGGGGGTSVLDDDLGAAPDVITFVETVDEPDVPVSADVPRHDGCTGRRGRACDGGRYPQRRTSPAATSATRWTPPAATPEAPAMGQVCERGDDGCLHWSAPIECPAGQSCNAGVCEDTCTSDPGCEAVGDLRCASASSYHLCQEVEADCLKFGEEQSCPEFTLCSPGLGCVCDTEATAACDTEGARTCFDEGSYRVCERTAAGCLVWSAPRDCADEGVCSGEGQCEVPCVSDPDCADTTTTRCHSADEVVTCEEVAAGCLQFGDPVDCPGALVCNAGLCETVCTSDCPAVGDVGCQDEAHSRQCEDVGEGCLKWSEPTACALHQVCGDGEGCVCDHACDEDETSCSADDDTLQRVCVSDDNGCRYWQYRYCPTGHVCEDGACLSTCVSDPGCTEVGVINCLSSAAYLVCEEVEEGCLQWGLPGGCGVHETCTTDGCVCLEEEGCDTTDLAVCASGDEAS